MILRLYLEQLQLLNKIPKTSFRYAFIKNNAGIVTGSALNGLKPILVHQRLDFALLSMEQIINQAAKWYYMFDGKKSIPIVIRMIVGRGGGKDHNILKTYNQFLHIYQD